MHFCVGRAIMFNLKEWEHGSKTILNFKLLFFTVTNWETSREGHQICRIIVWMDCHSSFHVDASFTNGSFYSVLYFRVKLSNCSFSQVWGFSSTDTFWPSVQWTNLLNPDNIKGLSALSMLLAMIGNGLMIPRALFTRDLMWYGTS